MAAVDDSEHEVDEERVARIIGIISRQDPDTGAELLNRVTRRDPHRKPPGTPAPGTAPRKEATWSGGQNDGTLAAEARAARAAATGETEPGDPDADIPPERRAALDAKAEGAVDRVYMKPPKGSRASSS